MHSLSARLLVLTISFVMLAEVLIFVPSVARFREAYFLERLRNANLAILALNATPDGVVSDALKRQLLETVGAEAISVRYADMRVNLIADQPPEVAETFDLRSASAMTLIADAFAVYVADDNRVVRVVGAVEDENSAEIQVVLQEGPLAAAYACYA